MSSLLEEHFIPVLADIVKSYSEEEIFSEDLFKQRYLKMTPQEKAAFKERLRPGEDPSRSFSSVREEYFNIYTFVKAEQKIPQWYTVPLKEKFEIILSYASVNEVPDYDEPVYYDLQEDTRVGKKKYRLAVEARSSQYAAILLYLYHDLITENPPNTRVQDISEMDLQGVIKEMTAEGYGEEMFTISPKLPEGKTLITRDLVENMIKRIGEVGGEAFEEADEEGEE